EINDVTSYVLFAAGSPSFAAIARLAGRLWRMQFHPDGIGNFLHFRDMVVRWRKVLVPVLETNLRFGIERDHPAYPIVDAEELVSGHELITLFIFRHPQLDDGFVPAVLLSAAIHRIEGGCLQLRQMITTVDRRVVFINEEDLFATRAAQLLNEFPRFHDSQYAALKKEKAGAER